MKKITLKITKRTKAIILGLSAIAAIGFSAMTHSTKAAGETIALVGLVASFKKKGIELTEDEAKHYGAIDEAFESHTKGLVTADDLKTQFEGIKETMSPEALKKMVDTATEELNESLRLHAAAIDQLKTMGVRTDNGSKSLRAQIKEGLENADVKAALKSMKNKEAGAKGFEFTLKSAAAMTNAATNAELTAATALSFPQPEFIPGLNDIARNQPFLVQLLKVMSTEKETIIYTEKYNAEGAAGWLGENAAAPSVDFDVRVGNSHAKLVSAAIDVSTQMLDDNDYMSSAIENELTYQVAIKIDSDLITGDGTGDNLAGIDSFAGGYTLTTLTTTTPNNCDAVIACATQIASDKFRPDIAVMNPIDYAQTTLLKGSDGHYIVNPNNKDTKWGKVMVVESNQVAAGSLLVMDSAKANLYRYKDLQISFGFINDNFKKNMVTVMANQRIHFFIKNNDVNAFIYDTLANIKTAITAV